MARAWRGASSCSSLTPRPATGSTRCSHGTAPAGSDPAGSAIAPQTQAPQPEAGTERKFACSSCPRDPCLFATCRRPRRTRPRGLGSAAATSASSASPPLAAVRSVSAFPMFTSSRSNSSTPSSGTDAGARLTAVATQDRVGAGSRPEPRAALPPSQQKVGTRSRKRITTSTLGWPWVKGCKRRRCLRLLWLARASAA